MEKASRRSNIHIKSQRIDLGSQRSRESTLGMQADIWVSENLMSLGNQSHFSIDCEREVQGVESENKQSWSCETLLGFSCKDNGEPSVI